MENLISEYSFTTVNGKHEVQYTAEKDKYYRLVIYAADSQGRPIETTEWIYNWETYYPYNTDKYTLSRSESYKVYKAGETARAEVRYNDSEPFAGENRRYLFVRLRSGIVDHTISENAVYEFPFERRFIPNISVKALCFDGTGIYNAGMITYGYDSSEKKLDISITPDRQSYKPGDEVKLTVDVKDRIGNPTAAEVNISIVDEAYFALYGQSANILAELYGRYVSSGFISEYLSYKPLQEDNPAGAEMGGEGGDTSVRKDFKDTALFTAVKTNSNGRAEITFRMPDNLTPGSPARPSQATQAGTKNDKRVFKLPFFVDTIFNKVFLTGEPVDTWGKQAARRAEWTKSPSPLKTGLKKPTRQRHSKLHTEIGLGT